MGDLEMEKEKTQIIAQLHRYRKAWALGYIYGIKDEFFLPSQTNNGKLLTVH